MIFQQVRDCPITRLSTEGFGEFVTPEYGHGAEEG
jgi:hypothetical protein